MSEDTDKLVRAILYQLRTTDSLASAIEAVEVIAGENNVALVNDKIAKREERINSQVSH